MGIFKQAMLSLGLILASGTYAKANETLKPKTGIEQILGSTEKAAKKIAAEPPEEKALEFNKLTPPKEKKEFPYWEIYEMRLSTDAFGSYKLPKEFKLHPDGTLRGYGLKWRLGDEDFYYNDFNINTYFESMRDDPVGGTISIGGYPLEDLFALFKDDLNRLGPSLYPPLRNLQEELLDIYKEKYTGKFVGSLFSFLLDVLPEYSRDGELTSGEYKLLWLNLEDFTNDFYAEDVTEEDKQRTLTALRNFTNTINPTFQYTTIDDIVERLILNPLGTLSLGGKTPMELKEFFSGLSDFIDIQINKKGVMVKGLLEGKGLVHAELLGDYKLKFGDKRGEFTHTHSTDQGISGRAFIDFKLTTKKGAPLYIYITDKSISLSLEQIGDIMGFHVHLLDADVNSKLGYAYQNINRISESFQFAELTENGKEGLGVVRNTEQRSADTYTLRMDGQLETFEKKLSLNLNAQRNSTYLSKDNSLIYFFKEGNNNKFWHYAMIGAEHYIEELINYSYETNFEFKADLQRLLEKKFETTTEMNSQGLNMRDPNTGARIATNFAFGLLNRTINPFFSYHLSPEELMKLGVLIDGKTIMSRCYIQAVSDPNGLNKPLWDKEDVLTETSFVLFDNEGNKKLMDYYVKSEQIDASPKLGKTAETKNALTELYSRIDGLMITAKTLNKDYSLRALWGFDSPLFLGGSYFGNLSEKLHGGDIVLGYDKLALIGGLGISKIGNYYNRDIRLSVAGTMKETSVYLDLHGLIIPDSEERYINSRIMEEKILGSLNIAGTFDEINILKGVTAHFERIGEDIVRVSRIRKE